MKAKDTNYNSKEKLDKNTTPSKKNDKLLVLVINELHHDFMASQYDNCNKRMYVSEKQRWEKVFYDLAKTQTRPLKILEIGCGTGFVSSIAKSTSGLVANYICADISAKILPIAKKNISLTKIGKENKVHFEFVKMRSDTFKLPTKENSVDAILFNSVLHHLPQTDEFFKEAKRALTKNGIIVAGHEPSSRYNKSLGIIMFKFIALIGRIKSGMSSQKDPMVDFVNKNLQKKGLITQNLSSNKIASMIDYKVEQGFDPFTLGANHGFKLVHARTYNHLQNITFNYPIFPIRICEKILHVIEPKRGGIFFAIYKKSN